MFQLSSVSDLIEFSDDGPVTRKVLETDRTIVLLVCLKPGQQIPPFSHSRREAVVHSLTGKVRITPGEGPSELTAGNLAFYDGSKQAAPRNTGQDDAAFLVTLVRKKGD